MYSLKNKKDEEFEVEKIYDYKLHRTVYVIVKHCSYMKISKVYNIDNMWWELDHFNSFIQAVSYLKKNIEKLI